MQSVVKHPAAGAADPEFLGTCLHRQAGLDQAIGRNREAETVFLAATAVWNELRHCAAQGAGASLEGGADAGTARPALSVPGPPEGGRNDARCQLDLWRNSIKAFRRRRITTWTSARCVSTWATCTPG